ncbi:ATP-dependent nuclease [Sphingosinithalassobacter portus]|uniref:ATP-dependent nuclease n=1 Tax=Stakelama portus TaxID=2676234 RepID=UPI000D6EA742|nr:ATP-dependent endonuclease [Sphingosinithalassobacter portus]
MRLIRADIKNFRAICDLSVDIRQHTTLIGANGVGKSCILKAIDKFFSKSANISIEDFHERNVSDPIEITLTFSDFTCEEAEVFSSKIHENQMSVSRIFYAGAAARDNGKYFGVSLRSPALQAIRLIEGATQRRAAHNALAGTEGFEDLLAASNATQLAENMEAWEAAHPENCVLAKDDGQFFGFSNVARGSLAKFISFVFVPAVRDATSDSTDSRGSVINQLIELIVKSVVQKREDIVAWQAEASKKYKELLDPQNLGELAELASELSETLNVFYGETNIDLNWRTPEDLQVALPFADVKLMEQGYVGPVENKGHGLQRAFIFTLLQHLAKALSLSVAEDVENDEQEAEAIESHSVILAIEEPELYQHPIKQRHIAKVLERISAGHIPGVMSQTQVILCSHSPHFVSTERFDDVCLARREVVEEGQSPQCVVRRVSYQAVLTALDAAYLNENPGHDVEGLKARLHVVDESVNEGFFCNVAVLVEGVGDRAALLAVAGAKQIDLPAAGIAIIPVGGKGNLDRPLAIFRLLKIPTYVIFDSDGDKNEGEQKPHQNLAIQRLCGETDPVSVRMLVASNFASFDTNLNIVLKEELGEHYQNQVEIAAFKYGMKAKDVVKNPVGFASVVSGCLALGGTCGTLSNMLDRILELT